MTVTDTDYFTGFPDNATVEEENKLTVFEQEVSDRRNRILADQEARRQIVAEGAQLDSLPGVSTLATRLAGPRPEVKWRVEGMWPVDGRVNLVAAPKAGKTTMVSNIVRSLLDGDDFLGAYRTDPLPTTAAPSIIVFDFEMTEEQLLDWYEAQNVNAAERVDIIPLRGHAGAFNFLNPTIRDELVHRYAGGHTYVLDPAGPVLSALGLEENSNSDVQRFLSEWDTFVRLLGGRESLVTVHAGHNAERARGASAFLGSGDAVWTMVRDGDDTDAPRFMKAIGRGVKLSETQLEYHFHRLTLGTANRQDVQKRTKATKAVPYVLDALRKHGPGTPYRLWDAVKATAERDEWGVGRQAFVDGFRLAREQGALGNRELGKGTEYYLLDPSRG